MPLSSAGGTWVTNDTISAGAANLKSVLNILYGTFTPTVGTDTVAGQICVDRTNNVLYVVNGANNAYGLAFNQSLRTTDSPTFAGLSLSNSQAIAFGTGGSITFTDHTAVIASSTNYVATEYIQTLTFEGTPVINWVGTTNALFSSTVYPSIIYANALTAEGATPAITGFNLAGTYNIGGTPTIGASVAVTGTSYNLGSASNYFAIGYLGRLEAISGFHIGEGTWTADKLLYCYKSWGTASTDAYAVYGYRYETAITGPSNKLIGVFGQAQGYLIGNGNTWGWNIGVFAQGEGTNSGDLGAVTNAVGLYVSNAGYSTNITNKYGIYIENMTKGSTNEAIHIVGGTIGGTYNIGGTPTLTGALTITGGLAGTHGQNIGTGDSPTFVNANLTGILESNSLPYMFSKLSCYLLQAYFPLDEGSGTVAYDMSGNNHLLNFSVGVSYAAANYGTGLQFDGLASNCTISETGFISTAATISIWISKPNWQEATPIFYSDFRGILGNRTNGNNFFVIDYRNDSSNPRINFEYQSGGSDVAALSYSTSSWTANSFHHIVITFISNQFQLFVDGVLQATSLSGATFTRGITLIGKAYVGGTLEKSWDGIIDELYWFNRVISAGEVISLYQNEPLPIPETLINQPVTVGSNPTFVNLNLTGNSTVAGIITGSLGVVTDYLSGDYGLTWTQTMPTGINGMTVVVYNSNAGILSSRLYVYSNGGWHYTALT